MASVWPGQNGSFQSSPKRADEEYRYAVDVRLMNLEKVVDKQTNQLSSAVDKLDDLKNAVNIFSQAEISVARRMKQLDAQILSYETHRDSIERRINDFEAVVMSGSTDIERCLKLVREEHDQKQSKLETAIQSLETHMRHTEDCIKHLLREVDPVQSSARVDHRMDEILAQEKTAKDLIEQRLTALQEKVEIYLTEQRPLPALEVIQQVSTVPKIGVPLGVPQSIQRITPAPATTTTVQAPVQIRSATPSRGFAVTTTTTTAPVRQASPDSRRTSVGCRGIMHSPAESRGRSSSMSRAVSVEARPRGFAGGSCRISPGTPLLSYATQVPPMKTSALSPQQIAREATT